MQSFSGVRFFFTAPRVVVRNYSSVVNSRGVVKCSRAGQEMTKKFQSSVADGEARASRPYDVIVFGSTGYTGKFVNEELYRLQTGMRQDLKWAAAGRCKDKLEETLRGDLL